MGLDPILFQKKSEYEKREIYIGLVLRGQSINKKNYKLDGCGNLINPKRQAIKILMNHYDLESGRAKRNLRKYLTYKNKNKIELKFTLA